MKFKNQKQHTKKLLKTERVAAKEQKKAERIAKASGEWTK